MNEELNEFIERVEVWHEKASNAPTQTIQLGEKELSYFLDMTHLIYSQSKSTTLQKLFEPINDSLIYEDGIFSYEDLFMILNELKS